MKTASLLIAFLLLQTINAQEITKDNTGISIDVIIDNITNNNGKVLPSLNTEETFMKGKGIMNLQSEIENGKIHVTFNNVPPGKYAILALHDANDNKRMDFDTSGMPMESYGMSNNEMSYRPPQFSDASFTVGKENLSFNIRF